MSEQPSIEHPSEQQVQPTDLRNPFLNEVTKSTSKKITRAALLAGLGLMAVLALENSTDAEAKPKPRVVYKVPVPKEKPRTIVTKLPQEGPLPKTTEKRREYPTCKSETLTPLPVDAAYLSMISPLPCGSKSECESYFEGLCEKERNQALEHLKASIVMNAGYYGVLPSELAGKSVSEIVTYLKEQYAIGAPELRIAREIFLIRAKLSQKPTTNTSTKTNESPPISDISEYFKTTPELSARPNED